VELVGLADIADMLAVSSQSVNQLTNGSRFPEPVAFLEAVRVWDRDAILAWARTAGREIVGVE
jgi:predicted DNA-binding transcriptional regulator AlpA